MSLASSVGMVLIGIIIGLFVGVGGIYVDLILNLKLSRSR